MTHREYVVSGRIRCLTDEGTEAVGAPGDFLFISPGHRAWVVGDETCSPMAGRRELREPASDVQPGRLRPPGRRRGGRPDTVVAECTTPRRA